MHKKDEPNRAEAIRDVLTKHPDLDAAQVVATLAKKHIEVNASNFYDTKSRMVKQGLIPATGKPTGKRRKKHRKLRFAKPVEAAESVELTMLRRDNQKLRAVIATI